MLMPETCVPYDAAKVWSYWHKEARRNLPEPCLEYVGRLPEDDREYDMHYRLVSVDPLKQQTTGEMWTLLFRDRQLVGDETRSLTSNYYFRNEMLMLLEKAGFRLEAEKGDWTDADPSADHDIIVYFARK
jgi:hypothetical protein